MRKIILSNHISLDGFVAGVNGEMDWIKFDEEMFDFVKEFTDLADTALYGRVTWQMMDNYWPTAGEQQNASKHDKEHSSWYNKVLKVVLSKTMKGEVKDKTIFIGGDVEQQITELKNEKGNNILIFGSPTAVHSLMRFNLIDEYWLFVNPVILGNGIPMFTKLEHQIDLKINESKIFPCGVMALNYSKA